LAPDGPAPGIELAAQAGLLLDRGSSARCRAAASGHRTHVFRNRPEYRFEGRLHEQIAHRLPGDLPERLEQTSVRLEHYGYRL
jgi:hypothetical protein